MAGLFAKAATLAPAKTAKAKQDKKEIEIPKLQQLAEIDALMKALKGAREAIEAEVKTAGLEQFLEMEGSTRIESFRGIDGMASGSIEMRKRSTNSALTEDECKVFREHGIEPFEQTVQQQLFAINPAYAENADLMAKVEKALVKVTGLPEDFIVQQPGVTKFVVTDEMLSEVWKKRDRTLVEIGTCMAVKPKLNEEYPMASLFENVKAIVQPEVKAKKAVLPGTKKTAKAA